MKKLFLTLSFAAAFLMAAELKGVISDSGCGAKHGPGKENVGCVNGCIKGKGASPVFVTADGKVHKIHNADKVGADLTARLFPSTARSMATRFTSSRSRANKPTFKL